jgi:hypothetical protein
VDIAEFNDAALVNRKLGATAALFGVFACSAGPSKKPLTEQAFNIAKQKCGATSAYIFESSGGRAVAFRGVASDFKARKAEAKCLNVELKGTDIRFIGFISEPPR